MDSVIIILAVVISPFIIFAIGTIRHSKLRRNRIAEYYASKQA